MTDQLEKIQNGSTEESTEKETAEMRTEEAEILETENLETESLETENLEAENFESDALEIDEEEEIALPEDLADFVDNETPSFTRLSDKYADIMSSATTMLVVGTLGIIFLILVFCGVIPLPLSSSTSWLFDSVMGGIFIIFVIAGLISYMRAKQVKIDAQAEDELIAQIQSWSEDAFSKDALDQGLDLTQPMELLYFSRTEKIKDALMHQFENADEALVAEMAEDIYQRLYEK